MRPNHFRVEMTNPMLTPKPDISSDRNGSTEPAMVELVLAAIPPAKRAAHEAAALAERLGADRKSTV